MPGPESTPQERSSARGTDQQDTAGKDIFALAFRGGALDTVVDLGVIHALLVSRREPPHVVVGSSTGAISAAALAEVFQEPTEERKVARFRQFLDAYIEAPRELARKIAPDTNEVRAETPLESIDLPIYPERERTEREESVRTAFGLIRLINDLLSLRLRISDLTRLMNLVLWWNHTGDDAGWRRWGKRTVIALTLWGFAFTTLWRVTPVTWRIIRAYLWPKYVAKPKNASLLIRTTYQWLVNQRRILFRILAGVISYVVLLLAFPSGLLLWLVAGTAFVLNVPSLYAGPVLVTAGALLGMNLLVWLALGLALRRGHLFKRLLRQYRLHDELGSGYTLKQYLVRLFDPEYYGKFDIEDTVQRALTHSPRFSDSAASQGTTRTRAKTLRDYAEPAARPGTTTPPPSIHVTPVVTNLCDGEAVPVAPDAPVIDAILGSLAVAPLFKPMWLPVIHNRTGEETKVPCIDALNVVNEPIVALLNYLRWAHHRLPVKRPARIHLYQVTPFPTRKPLETQQQYERLIDVVRRVVDLRRYQSASLERELALRFTKIMPEGDAIQVVPIQGKEKPLVAVDIHRIDTPDAVRMLKTWISKDTAHDKRTSILKAVATGCRSALHVVAAHEIYSGATAAQKQERQPIDCRTTIRAVLGRDSCEMPGSDADGGPGLSEVCQACAWTEPAKGKLGTDPIEHRRKIPWPEDGGEDHQWPIWPDRAPADHAKPEFSPPPAEAPTPARRSGSPADRVHAVSNSASSPAASSSPAPSAEPWVTLLFGGGVFRGVFQVGMLNGLVQAGVNPRVFAGSSVGSIMAAMASRIFAGPNDPTAEAVRVAETFLGLDRLVLTDRFADLVRRLTLRAGATAVSIRDLDHLFRLYERRRSGEFGRNTRRVLAGLERLLYLTPYDVERVARSLREGDYATTREYLIDAGEALLAGYGIGAELLGTEPLQTMVLGHVLESKRHASQTIDEYLQTLKAPTRHLLISTTNLTTGSLEMLGAGHRGTPLLKALLASSAFPGVFRPLRSGEVFPHAAEVTQLVDGGVMDNLPLLKVLEALEQAAASGELVRRPPIPHLIITGSLQPPCNTLDPVRDQAELAKFSEDWMQLVRRIRMLRFNKKVDAFARAQESIQALWEHWHEGKTPSEQGPLNIRVATVKPHWLCGTFAFHPMLGFRREKQAASIAHGCAATLVTLASVKGRDGYESKGIFKLHTDSAEERNWRNENGDLLPQPRRKAGDCWFQVDRPCPFYRSQENRSGAQAERNRAVHRIYELCGRAETHQREVA